MLVQDSKSYRRIDIARPARTFVSNSLRCIHIYWFFYNEKKIPDTRQKRISGLFSNVWVLSVKRSVNGTTAQAEMRRFKRNLKRLKLHHLQIHITHHIWIKFSDNEWLGGPFYFQINSCVSIRFVQCSVILFCSEQILLSMTCCRKVFDPIESETLCIQKR